MECNHNDPNFKKMGNNKGLEVCFTGKSQDANITSRAHPVNPTGRQFTGRKKTIMLLLLRSVNTKRLKRPINPSKVSFISAAVDMLEVT